MWSFAKRFNTHDKDKGRRPTYLFPLCCGFHTLQFQGSRLPTKKILTQFEPSQKEGIEKQLI